MKHLRQILFTAVVVIGFSLTASAQDNREKKEKPPKENAEIKPEDKKPKNNENNNNKTAGLFLAERKPDRNHLDLMLLCRISLNIF
jgi:hypothetical protein